MCYNYTCKSVGLIDFSFITSKQVYGKTKRAGCDGLFFFVEYCHILVYDKRKGSEGMNMEIKENIDSKLKEDTIIQIREKYLKPLNENTTMSNRRYKETEKREREDGEWQRDYTRIMYASAFRRLQGKMQLLGIQNDQFFRNRLTHSMEVSQIARSIADKLKYEKEESYVVEAGALAHDIGNPPFGHAGERKLNELARDIGGFEGNAQTLRILTTVEQKRKNFQGLNLTNRTLFSVIKYRGKFNKRLKKSSYNKQKFLYLDDLSYIDKVSKDTSIYPRTLDVQIVDLADEIAYAAHDLEDGLRCGKFTIDEILQEFYNNYGDCESFKLLEEIVRESRDKAGYKHPNIDSAEYTKLYRKELASRIINTLIHDIDLIPLDKKFIKKTGTKNEEELGFATHKILAEGLKKTTYSCINHNDEVYLYEDKGNKVLEFLYEYYQRNTQYLPPEYRAELIRKQYDLKNVDNIKKFQNRLIIDYLSGMMDTYAINAYERLRS